MSEWWTYRLSDFLMFSPGTYWRLVERYNRDTWPLHVVMLAAGLALWWLSARRHRFAQPAVLVVLAAIWLWVGWAFHWRRYAPINWAAAWLAAAYVLQAVLMFAVAILGISRRSGPVAPWAAAGASVFVVLGVLLYPLMGVLAGRPFIQSEVFGLMPEPTAAATLGLVFATNLPWRGLLAAIPAMSLVLGLLTLLAFS